VCLRVGHKLGLAPEAIVFHFGLEHWALKSIVSPCIIRSTAITAEIQVFACASCKDSITLRVRVQVLCPTKCLYSSVHYLSLYKSEWVKSVPNCKLSYRFDG
jgi:hypothetical protein